MKKGIIDRFEGELAVVELRKDEIKDIPKKKLPKEGKSRRRSGL